MPSLVPQKALALGAMPDLPAVFKGQQTAATRERVINWLAPIYEEYSDIDVEKAWSKTQISEELHIPMPTVAAYATEIELCNAILEHAAGEMSDAVMQLVLKTFLDTHIWIYHPDGPRTNKSGKWGDWTRGVALYRLGFEKAVSGPENKQATIICNPIQAWILRLLEERRGSTHFSLHRI